MNVDILMATYNGARFIEAQIFSLLSQTFENWRLIIHDDGSSDKTVEKVKKMQKMDDRIILIEDGRTFGNAGANFLHLLTFSKADYVMFCDQDDVWFDSKIAIYLEEIKNSTQPMAVYSNGYTYNGEVITSTNFINFHRTNIEDSIFLNGGIHGCCIMFNRALVKIFENQMPDYVFMHDHFITMAAVTFGKMKYIDKALMLYRQHDTNVTGNVQLSFIDRLKVFLDTKNPVLDEKHFEANKSFYLQYKDQLNEKQAKLFEAYLNYPSLSKFSRLRMIYTNHFKSQNQIQLLLKTLIRKAM